MTKYLIRHFVPDYQNTTSPSVRKKYGMFSGLVGIICNVALAFAKFIAGILTSSIAISADAMNNLSDAGSSIVTLVGFKVADAPADDDHPFGHGRAEYIAGFIIAMVICLMGIELARSSFDKIIHPQAINFSVVSLCIMLASILVKFFMSLFYRTVANDISSKTIKAASTDSIVDVVGTIAVVLSMLVSHFAHFNIDGYTGLAVSIFIIYTGFITARDTLNPLLGEAPNHEFVLSIETKVMSYSGIVGVHDLIVHNYGSNKKLISLHAEVPCNINIMEIHDTIDNIERDIKREYQCDAVIHMDPIVVDDKVSKAMRDRILALVRLIDPTIDIHDFRMVEGKTHTNLIFDVVIPHKFRLTDSEVIDAISRAVKVLDDTFEVVIDVDKRMYV